MDPLWRELPCRWQNMCSHRSRFGIKMRKARKGRRGFDWSFSARESKTFESVLLQLSCLAFFFVSVLFSLEPILLRIIAFIVSEIVLDLCWIEEWKNYRIWTVFPRFYQPTNLQSTGRSVWTSGTFIKKVFVRTVFLKNSFFRKWNSSWNDELNCEYWRTSIKLFRIS